MWLLVFEKGQTLQNWYLRKGKRYKIMHACKFSNLLKIRSTCMPTVRIWEHSIETHVYQSKHHYPAKYLKNTPNSAQVFIRLIINIKKSIMINVSLSGSNMEYSHHRNTQRYLLRQYMHYLLVFLFSFNSFF